MKSSALDKRETVDRISISLAPGLTEELDAFVEGKKFECRSQAVSAMIREQLLQSRQENPGVVMAGSITLFFSQNRAGILEELAALKRRCVDEVIGALQVQLEDGHLMEVILVQGPVGKLEEFTDALLACKGVKAGKLTLTSTLIPPLHPLPPKKKNRPARTKKS